MNNSAIFDAIMTELGGRTNPALRVKAVQRLNTTIDSLENGVSKPWFLETEIESDMVANQAWVSLPTDFIQETEEGDMRVNYGDGFFTIVKVTYRRLTQKTENADSGKPEGYAVYGSKIFFGPAPSEEYAYRFPYYGRTEDVADNASPITNPWLLNYFDMVVAETALKMALVDTHSNDVALRLEKSLVKMRKEFEASVEARTNANLTPLLGNTET